MFFLVSPTNFDKPFDFLKINTIVKYGRTMLKILYAKKDVVHKDKKTATWPMSSQSAPSE